MFEGADWEKYAQKCTKPILKRYLKDTEGKYILASLFYPRISFVSFVRMFGRLIFVTSRTIGWWFIGSYVFCCVNCLSGLTFHPIRNCGLSWVERLPRSPLCWGRACWPGSQWHRKLCFQYRDGRAKRQGDAKGAPAREKTNHIYLHILPYVKERPIFILHFI